MTSAYKQPVKVHSGQPTMGGFLFKGVFSSGGQVDPVVEHEPQRVDGIKVHEGLYPNPSHG